MKEQKEEKWLGELIADVINSSKPQFDAEQWKEKYPEEFKMLVSRAEQSSQTSIGQPNVWRMIWKNPITRIAAAVVIIVNVSFLIVLLNPNKQAGTAKTAQYHISPAELTTFASLSFAYRKGGMEMVEQMCDKALTMAGPRPAKISMQDLLEKNNGKNPERTKL
jgi:hypothetical protein